eukprot:COSAG02_NODE_1727_length_11182_cov_40.189209_4_plen_57_part_00
MVTIEVVAERCFLFNAIAGDQAMPDACGGYDPPVRRFRIAFARQNWVLGAFACHAW